MFLKEFFTSFRFYWIWTWLSKCLLPTNQRQEQLQTGLWSQSSITSIWNYTVLIQNFFILKKFITLQMQTVSPNPVLKVNQGSEF